MILCYVDDLLTISGKSEGLMQSVQERFKLKGDKFRPPNDYLGTQLSTTINGKSSEKFGMESVKNVEQFLKSKGRSLPTRLRTPIHSDHKPKLDTSPELAAEGHSDYQELIGILRWAVELVGWIFSSRSR
jgi:hypothetical protein